MFLIPGITALFTFVYLRPQEVFETWKPVTIVSVLAVVALTFVLDLRVGVARPTRSPVMGALMAFVALCLLTVAVQAPGDLGDQAILLGTGLLAFLFVALGLQSLRAVEAAGTVLLAMTLILAFIGINQGLAPKVCYQRGAHTATADGEVADGRPCVNHQQCEEGGVPGADYLCEHEGLFDTHSIGGRVRFRGLLEDPNELAMAMAMGAPLAFGFFERRRGLFALLVLLGTLAASFACVIMTQSRSGQLSMLAVMGVYFVRRFGRKGVALAVVFSVPLLLLGGRSGAEAESSSEERLECWAEALQMWRDHPLFGVGQGQFAEHHYLTAHSSFMLTLAELGPIGLTLWCAALYAAVKIVLRAQLDFAGNPEAAAARSWATALLASLAGMIVSALFLSVAYHAIVWLFLGLTAALHGAVRAHAPDWSVRFGMRDLLLVIGIDFALVVGISTYIQVKGI